MKLLSAWAAEGFSPAEFWQQTAESWNAIMAGRSKFHEAQAERDLAVAWMSARFARADKLGPLDSYLKRQKAPPSLAETFAQWDALAAAGYAITVEDCTIN